MVSDRSSDAAVKQCTASAASCYCRTFMSLLTSCRCLLVCDKFVCLILSEHDHICSHRIRWQHAHASDQFRTYYELTPLSICRYHALVKRSH
jgi:hypothetical protein